MDAGPMGGLRPVVCVLAIIVAISGVAETTLATAGVAGIYALKGTGAADAEIPVAWSAPGTVRSPEGHPSSARLAILGDEFQDGVYAVDGGGRVLSRTWETTAHDRQDRPFANVLPATYAVDHRFLTTVYPSGVEATPPCGLQLPGLESPAPCRMPSGDLLAGPWDLGTDNERRTFSGPMGSVVEVANVALPLRIATHKGSLTLTHYGTSYALGAPSSGPSASPLSNAGRMPWGPVDDGTAHPFPLSSAYQQALADPTHPRLAQFLEAHPGAVTERAEPFQYEGLGGVVAYAWRIVVTDGHDRVAACPARTIREVAGLAVPHAGPKDLVLGQSAQDGCEVPQGPPPDPARIPASVPTAASLLARWAGFADRAPSEGNSWGFAWAPSTDGGVVGTWWAGRVEIREDAQSQEGGLGRFHLEAADVVTFDGAGRAQSHDVLSTQRQHTVLDPATLLRPDAASAVARAADVEDLRPTFLLFAGAATATLAAILVARWLGIVTFFTRLDSGRLLAHPVRARLHELIGARPGIHLGELMRLLHLGRGSALHHITLLKGDGRIAERVAHGYRCYHLAGAADRRIIDGLPALKSDGACRVLGACLAGGPIIGAEIARGTGFSPQTVHYHLLRLERAGLLVNADDPLRGLRPAAHAKTTLETASSWRATNAAHRVGLADVPTGAPPKTLTASP